MIFQEVSRNSQKGEILKVEDMESNPINEFKKWFYFAQKNVKNEPNAMIVSTLSKDGLINSRTVLLKNITEKGLIFFTNYESKKGADLSNNNIISSVFLWKEIERQIIIRGKTDKISKEDSSKYFNSRPRKSRIAAWASDQSKDLENETILSDKFKYYEKKFNNKNIPLPDFWGGFIIKPFSIEFWQGRSSRMHDRVYYEKINESWVVKKLYP